MNTKPSEFPDLAHSEQVRRYVRGDLPDHERADLERALLDSPALQAAVEAELLLRDHADAMPQSAERPLRRAPAWSIAAALVAGALGGYLAPRKQPVGEAAFVAPTVSFAGLRNADVREYAACAGRRFVARFLAATDDPHRLQITAADGRTVLALSGLTPNADGDLSVVILAPDAAGSPYRVHLDSRDRQEQFSLNVGECMQSPQ